MLKRIYFKLILIGYYLKKSWVYWLVGVSIGFLLYIGRGHLVKIKQLPTFQKQYVGVAGRYTTANLPSEINDLLTYGLTTFTENKKVIASPIVESIYQEDDNHRYIIKLKDNIFWHNGKKLTAADINYNLAGAVIKPEDSLTLMITTPNLFSPLLAALNQPLYKKNLIGLGPNKAIQIDYQGGYLKKLVIQNRDSKIKTVYKFYFSDPDLITAFKLGEVDKIETNLLPTDIEKWNNVNLNQKISPDKKYLAVFLNTEKLNNKSIRQALAYATPKTKDRHERALSPISPNSWAYNPTVKEYNFDPERAKELLGETDLGQLKIAVADRQLLNTAENIKKSWHDILGIEVETQIVNKIDPQNFDAFLAYGGILADPDQYLFWHSTQTQTNLTKFNNSRIDKLLEEGRQTFDPIERKKIYQDFQKYLLEECPAIFLSYPTIYTISRLK